MRYYAIRVQSQSSLSTGRLPSHNVRRGHHEVGGKKRYFGAVNLLYFCGVKRCTSRLAESGGETGQKKIGADR